MSRYDEKVHEVSITKVKMQSVIFVYNCSPAATTSKEDSSLSFTSVEKGTHLCRSLRVQKLMPAVYGRVVLGVLWSVVSIPIPQISKTALRHPFVELTYEL
jgi:hypothetical protein